jgi:hypothetical protein
MKRTIFLLAVSFFYSSILFAQTKPRAKKPSNFSWGAEYPPTKIKSKDSIRLKQSGNDVAMEERRKHKNTSTVKLDDLKNPFDTAKVKAPKETQTGNQKNNRRKHN